MAKLISFAPQELKIWLDEFMVKWRSELHIPEVTFSLVQNGEILLAKGYGYANLEPNIPVSGDRPDSMASLLSLFRGGSVSKLFMTTAIMQLVEKNMIDLDEDVNRHLTDFPIEDNYPQSVTIANVLTHMAGFDDRLVGLFTRKTKDIKLLRKILGGAMSYPKRHKSRLTCENK